MPEIETISLAAFMEAGRTEAGCDEAGRGCLAGPVVAAAVILPVDFHHPLLNDSKKMTEKSRDILREVVIKESITWGVDICSPKEIDKLNILWASVAAMHKAILKMNKVPDHILVDGNRFKPFKKIPYTCVIKGDGKFSSIAAASVLAKTFRDDMMRELHDKHPAYGWNQNKGYPTEYHRQAIERHGACVHHRKSFTLLPIQTELIF